MLTPTGATTQDYIGYLKADSPVHIKMTFASQGITLTDQDVDISNGLILNDILNGDIDLTFGRAVMKQMTIGILNTSRVSDLIWTDEFTLELGVEINGTTNYVKIGTFVGEKPNNVTSVQVINFTAYDYMGKFDKLVDDYWTNVSFPASVETIYHGLCNYIGVGYISGDELPNIMSRTFTTAPAQLQGYTCRDLLAWIAEACGCYAKINADGNCKMVWYTDHSSDLAFALDDEFHIETADLNTGLTWDEFDEYYWNDADKLEWNDVCSYEEAYVIDSVQVKQLGADIDVCYPTVTDGNIYMIVENPFLSVESPSDITNYIKPLYDRLISHGGHLPMAVQCIGNYLVETGDIISVDVDDTHTLIAPVYSRTFRWYGTCRDEYETTGNVERTVISTENRAKLVNRNNIRLVASDLYYNIQSGVDITPDGVEISGNKYIKIKSGSAIDIESGGKFRITSDNFTIDENGNVTINGSGTFSGALNAATGTFSGSLNAATGTFAGTLSADCIKGGTLRLGYNLGQYGNLTIYDNNNSQIASFNNYGVSITSGTFNVTAGNFVLNSGYQHMTIIEHDYIGNWYNDFGRMPAEIYCEDGTSQFGVYGNRHDFGISLLDRSNNSPIYSHGIRYYMDEENGEKIAICSIRSYYKNNINDSSYSILNTRLEVRNIKTYYINCQTELIGNKIYYTQLIQNSSRDIKHNIKRMEPVGNKIDALKPIIFIYDNDPDEKERMGLIYEDTIGVMPEICTNDESRKAINYVELIPALLKEIQDLRSRVKALERGDN